MALSLDNTFAKVYDEKVVQKMNNLQKMFPKPLPQDPLLKKNITEFVDYCK